MRLLDWRVVGQLFLKASSLQRKRATLTVAAIAWGTVAIIMLLSFGEGLKIQLMKGRRGMGENIAVWWPDETSKVWQGLPEGRPIRPRMDDIEYLRGRMTAASGVIGEITSWSSSLTYGQTTITGRVFCSSTSSTMQRFRSCHSWARRCDGVRPNSWANWR